MLKWAYPSLIHNCNAYQNINFWSGNESEISNSTKNDDFLKKKATKVDFCPKIILLVPFDQNFQK